MVIEPPTRKPHPMTEDTIAGLRADEVVAELREASLDRQRVAWSRTDGGQEWSLAAILADKAADMIEELRESLAKAEGGAEALRALELRTHCVFDWLEFSHASIDAQAQQLADRYVAAESRAAALQSQVKMLAGALGEISDRHIPDCPSHFAGDELTWAQRQHGALRRIASDALASLKETPDV